MKRIYENMLNLHHSDLKQMSLVSGPRQVGKTTVAKSLSAEAAYLNYDITEDQKLIRGNSHLLNQTLGLNQLLDQKKWIIFDELHKYNKWKSFLKGFFDEHSEKANIVVTGSARLQIYKKMGDSLLGRYFNYRMHPLSVAEILHAERRPLDVEIVNPTINSADDMEHLFNYGGFPEPFIKSNMSFNNRWNKLRKDILLKEDVRDLVQIQDMSAIQVLADILSQEVGSLINYSKLASDINVSVDTIRRWINILDSIYYLFIVKPYSRNIRKSLIKNPKIYLWDWSAIQDIGKKTENFIASHLLKAVHFWTDMGLGDYDLFYLRDKNKREVDFLVTKNKKPWFLVEAKHGDKPSLSQHLFYFQKETKAPFAFQVNLFGKFIDRNCFESKEYLIVPGATFLSQLV